MEFVRLDSQCNSCERNLDNTDKNLCFDCLLVFCPHCVRIEDEQCKCRLCNLVVRLGEVTLTPETLQELTKRDLQTFLLAQCIPFESTMDKPELINIVTDKLSGLVASETSSDSSDNLVEDFELLGLLTQEDQLNLEANQSSPSSSSAQNESEPQLGAEINDTKCESSNESQINCGTEPQVDRVGSSDGDTLSTNQPPPVTCHSCEEACDKNFELHECSNCKLVYCIFCIESFDCEDYKCRRCLFFNFYNIPLTQDTLEDLHVADLRWFLKKQGVENLEPNLAKQQLINRILIHLQSGDQSETKDKEETKIQVETHYESKLCKICLVSDMNCVLVGCGHMMCCNECGTRLLNSKSSCPICRTQIVQVQRIYLS